MNEVIKKIEKKGLAVTSMTCLFAAPLLCGCEGQEISKTIVLSDEATEENEGININNIQEYTYEEGILDATWIKDVAGGICLVRDVGNRNVYQKHDVYQKTLLEEVAFEEYPVGQVRIAPGGKYIAYDLMAEEYQQLLIYEIETGKKEVLIDREKESELYAMAWSGDGTRLFVWMEIADYNLSQEDGGIYRYDMEDEARTGEQVQLGGSGRKWRNLLPNEDGTQVFVMEGVIDYWELSEENMYVDEEEAKGLAEENRDIEESGVRNCILDMNTGEVRELDLEQINIHNPLKYTESGMFGLDGDQLFFAREPLGEVLGKRLLEAEYVDVCICEKGDHIFLIEKEERTDYLQVTGVLLDDGEIQEYQVLYKGIYGDYVQAFIGMDDHELVIQSVGYEEEGQWLLKATVLEY